MSAEDICSHCAHVYRYPTEGRSLRVGSLFSGIGAMDLGLARAGCHIIWQCEIDNYCRRVLEKHWPGVPKYGDIRELDAADLVPVDILAGGFPCTDISVAGKGAGIAGEYSGLWSDFARLVRDLRPRYVLVENVPGLLGRGMGAVLGDLAAIGYDAEWACISAADLGAPHERERVFIIACPQVADAESIGMERDRASRFSLTSIPAEAMLSRRNGAGGRTTHWDTEPRMGRLAPRSAEHVARMKAVGNMVPPQVIEAVGRRIVEDASCQS